MNIALSADEALIKSSKDAAHDRYADNPEGKRKPGLLAGKLMVLEDSMEKNSDINKIFYGK
ncbi:MAG TPA: hypothetical protein ENI62_06035 [Gammaproteobacteria bacterium]|nr:hypothetical protein [Gammaproteobacteria bacterium]